MNTIFVLLVLFQLKHFLADYPLQGKFMLGKFKGGTEWVLPLLCHVAVHGAFTFCIVALYKPNDALLFAMLDMSIHFVMDRVKASPEMLGRFKAISSREYGLLQRGKYLHTLYQSGVDLRTNPPTNIPGTVTDNIMPVYDGLEESIMKSNTYFWWSLGLDQGVHHLTHYLIIYLMVK